MPTHLIKSLLPLLGKEKVLELVREAADESVRAHRASPYYDGPRFESFGDFLTASQGMNSQLLTEPVHWNSELLSKTTQIDMTSLKLEENKVCFNITKCLWAEIFQEMDAADIGRAWSCHGDAARVKAWSPNMELRRTQTIMEGASHCDFCFMWNEKSDSES
jgi:hypothetical protein